MKKKRGEARDVEPEVEGSQPVQAGFLVVADRARRRREEFASDWDKKKTTIAGS